MDEFDYTYQLYGERVYSVALHFARDKEKAAELLKDAFLELYKEWDEISEESRCAYLAVTVKRLFEKQQKFDNGEKKA